MPLWVLLEEKQLDCRRLGGEGEQFTFVVFRTDYELTVLHVDGEPCDVHRTLSYRQLERTPPDTRSIGPNEDQVLLATCYLLFYTAVT